MAVVLYGGDDEFDAFAYGGNYHPNTIAFLEQQAVDFTQRLNDAGKQWIANVKDVYQKVDLGAAARYAKGLVRRHLNIWDTGDVVKCITTVDQFQQAEYKMQRFIMAEPSVRQAYHEKRCEGYADSYVDIDGKVYGENHYDYRRVMNGYVTFNENDGWESTTYFETLREGDVDLSTSEQIDIIRTWEWLKHHMSLKGDDPTSRFNSSL